MAVKYVCCRCTNHVCYCHQHRHGEEGSCGSKAGGPMYACPIDANSDDDVGAERPSSFHVAYFAMDAAVYANR